MRKAFFIVGFAALFFSFGANVRADDWRDRSFSEITEKAKGTEVSWYMYGGWAHVNTWVDSFAADALKEKYDIRLNRVPMDAAMFVNKLIGEKTAGRKKGGIDVLWVNGENFKNLKQAGALLGPFASMLPNFNRYIDPKTVEYDFGYPVEGYEAPYGRAQFIFEYDSAKTPDPPDSFPELLAWVKENPERFTYPQPPDFTGSAFIRQAFYAATGGREQYMAGFDAALYEKNSPKLWEYLNALKPYLWQSGRSHPKDSAALDSLFARGEVDLNMSYHPPHATNKIMEGAYPSSVRTYVFQDGSIYNIHFLAIPYNAPNVFGALVTIDFLLSVEAQLSKNDPELWGDFSVLDMTRLSPEDRKRFEALDLCAATLSHEELNRYAVPEIPSDYLERLEKDWEKNVLRK